MPPDCTIRADLGLQIADAVQDVYRLRMNIETTASESASQIALLNLLHITRKDQRKALRALADHIRVHGCQQ
jgi:hypothetical protein